MRPSSSCGRVAGLACLLRGRRAAGPSPGLRCALGARAPPQVYTPLVVLAAVLVAVVPPAAGIGHWRDWVYLALVCLVTSCPCALVISTPVTSMCGIARAAQQGVLIKGSRWAGGAGERPPLPACGRSQRAGLARAAHCWPPPAAGLRSLQRCALRLQAAAPAPPASSAPLSPVRLLPPTPPQHAAQCLHQLRPPPRAPAAAAPGTPHLAQRARPPLPAHPSARFAVFLAPPCCPPHPLPLPLGTWRRCTGWAPCHLTRAAP
jgi:hypothetical protein